MAEKFSAVINPPCSKMTVGTQFIIYNSPPPGGYAATRPARGREKIGFL
jgi:hypothetical protein